MIWGREIWELSFSFNVNIKGVCKVKKIHPYQSRWKVQVVIFFDIGCGRKWCCYIEILICIFEICRCYVLHVVVVLICVWNLHLIAIIFRIFKIGWVIFKVIWIVIFFIFWSVTSLGYNRIFTSMLINFITFITVFSVVCIWLVCVFIAGFIVLFLLWICLLVLFLNGCLWRIILNRMFFLNVMIFIIFCIASFFVFCLTVRLIFIWSGKLIFNGIWLSFFIKNLYWFSNGRGIWLNATFFCFGTWFVVLCFFSDNPFWVFIFLFFCFKYWYAVFTSLFAAWDFSLMSMMLSVNRFGCLKPNTKPNESSLLLSPEFMMAESVSAYLPFWMPFNPKVFTCHSYYTCWENKLEFIKAHRGLVSTSQQTKISSVKYNTRQ